MLRKTVAAAAVAGLLTLVPIDLTVTRADGALPRVVAEVSEAACQHGQCLKLTYHLCLWNYADMIFLWDDYRWVGS